MLKTFTRPAMIFIPFLLGVLFPQAHVLNDPPYNAVRWALAVMVFLSCLQIRFSELKPRREHWHLLGMNLLMGIVPYFVLRLLIPGNPVLANVAFFVGITPTATAAPVVIAFLNGRIGFALTGFTITNVFVSLSLLFLLPMVTGNFTVSFIGQVAVTLLQVIAFPFLAALVLRKIWPGIRDLPKKLKTFSFLLWSFTLFILAAIAREYFIENPQVSRWNIVGIAVISALICICNFWFGKYLAPKRYRRECSQLLGQKNTTFTMYLALHYASALVAMGPIFYIVCHNTWNAWQMYQYDRRKFLRQKRHDASRPEEHAEKRSAGGMEKSREKNRKKMTDKT